MLNHIVRLAAAILILVPALGLGALADLPADLELELVTGGLNRPVTIRHAGDGSGRLFIVEQAGRIRIFDLGTNTLLPTPFLDITSKVDDSSNEQGLLGLDFHPNYESNGLFYVNYTRDPGAGLDRTIVERYQVSAGNANAADLSSAFTMIEIEQDFANHNGGDIHFGPDGYLYMGMGDGGSGNDPNERAQDLGELLGKMLRIDVDGTTPGGSNDLCGLVQNYRIPPDNPFAGGNGDCDEIWALGVRNPWRWSFDRMTGDLLIGDVGQSAREEIDFQSQTSTGGENYGWSCKEGELNSVNSCIPGPLEAPVFTYSHAFGCSVTGGYRYRGPITAIDGIYFTGDYCSGRIWYGEETTPGTWSFTEWQDTSMNISSFGEDEMGNMYIADFATNSIYRLNLPFSVGASRVPDGSEPGESPLRISRSGPILSLTWDDSCLASDTDYAVYDGIIGGNFDDHDPVVCSTNGTTSASFGQGFVSRYFLVVPRNDAREGSYGLRSNGQERPSGGVLSCVSRAIESCP